ncbi:MAG: DUF4129 domain-containing protein [Cyclobacteriaceae bacterium]
MLVLSAQADGRDNLRSFDQSAIEEYKQDPQYNYRQDFAQTSILEQLITWLSEALTPIIGGPNSAVLATWILRLLLLGGVLITIYYLLKMRYGQVFSRADQKIFYTSLSHELEHTDYHQLLAGARKNGDMKRVLRYSYLGTIDQLSKKGLVNYSHWKTAREYSNELTGEQRRAFMNLSEIFESVWYGHLEPDQQLVERSDELRKELFND